MATQNAINNQTNWSIFAEGRLTLLTQSPLPSTDQTAATTLYYTPYIGDRISIYNSTASEWETIQFTEVSLDISAYTPNTLYDIFGYNNSGVLGLESVSWGTGTAYNISAATAADPCVITYANGSQAFAVGDTVCIQGITGNIGDGYLHDITTVTNIGTVSAGVSYSITVEINTTGRTYTSGGTVRKLDNTRATSITVQDLIPVKNGDTSRRLLGTICITGVTGQCEDSLSRRYVCNVNNTEPRKIRSNLNDADSFTHVAGTVYSLPIAIPDSAKPGRGRVNFISSYYAVPVSAIWSTAGYADTASSVIITLEQNVISVNSVEIGSDCVFTTATSNYSGLLASLQQYSQNTGFNYIQQLIFAQNTKTVTIWAGDTNTGSQYKFGMSGWLLM